ncbi:phage integrase, catalytic core [Actibacterium atlanticum]|uniref:Phage integrase, catalytic core n=1 Tax=Actibacterium atlanticum TaxID=1461693 RepID=A0A058ZLM5_9RHOB|nr:site-specific integrase [Actibacterium atlanticum]KCV82458.1 phage integrase, catalytic core [Actibacterium atlanticum]
MTVHNVLTYMKAKSLGQGKYADGQGLWLVKTRKDTGRWMLRLVVGGKRREMGLGSWPDVSIAEARERAALARRRLRDGVDPILERQQQRHRTRRLTLSDAVEGCFEARQAELKDDGKAGRWLSPLKLHVLPKLGRMAVADLDQHEIKKVLEPIWHTKSDTARKAMNRLNLTLQHAAALGLDVDLQATLKAKALLGKRRHVTQHIPSLPYAEIPDFYSWLREKSDLTSALALRFLIMTVARTSEVRFATFQEIEGDTWSIAAARTKTNRDHRIPLSDEAQNIIRSARGDTRQSLVFETSKGNPLSDAAMSSFMKREGFDARPHGFRATFRTWVEEQTDTPFEVKEASLGHNVDTGVVGAYQRSDRLEKRAVLMQQWANFVLSK